jgi:hypothetical protein
VKLETNKTPIAIAAAWFLVVCAGVVAVSIYKMTPSPQRQIAAVWPAGAQVTPSADRATLLLFAHPQCPCTRATLTELAGLEARYGDRLDTWVLFLSPKGVPANFTETDLRRSAERIPSVHVLTDEGGAEAARFGIATSGTVALYQHGKLLFHGGITPARGHEGESAGRERVVSLLTTGVADRNDAPVFGCSLSDDEEPVRVADSNSTINPRGN